MSSAQTETTLPESASVASPRFLFGAQNHSGEDRRFSDLRGVQWRINLGVLPSSSSSTTSDLRRVTADSRRRYVGLRRRLLVGPHTSKDEINSPNSVMDNPLSQNPDSTWGRFFRNAELGKMVDQDLSRLYPEHGSYFQTANCQGMLRRILLLWCLQHPENGYRQGMHELLAPLLYVLHVDVNRLSDVRKLYEDHFPEKFDDLSFHNADHSYNFDFKRPPDSVGAESTSHVNVQKVKSLDDLEPDIRMIILLNDAYGAEGELGIVSSEKFMEHDAYCMFDALMVGADGAIAMVDFFSPSPAGPHSALSPVIEASSALYHVLSLVDSSLHSHLVEIGVEPQYFALRWLRVLFGREFSLEDQVIIWDEIFASDNSKLDKGDDEVSNFAFLSSSRGAFISAIAVSMLLYLRSSLLATEHATSCLQRLLNFPENVDLKKLIEKAKSVQTLALNSNISSLPSLSRFYSHNKPTAVRGHCHSYDFSSSKRPLNLVPESYWEEKWRVVHREEELKKGTSRKQIAAHKKGWSEKVRFLSRTESDPSPAKLVNSSKDMKPSVRRRLLEDLSLVLGSDEDDKKINRENDGLSAEGEVDRQDDSSNDGICVSESICLGENVEIGENSSMSSDPNSPLSRDNDHEIDNSGRSSVASSILFEGDGNQSHVIMENESLPVSHPPRDVFGESCEALQVSQNLEDVSEKLPCNIDHGGKVGLGTKDRKLLSGKFSWLWKLGRNADGTSATEQTSCDNSKLVDGESNGSSILSSSTVDDSRSSFSSKNECSDQNVISTFRNIGQSMLEHIQVIESAFQHDRVHMGSTESLAKNGLVGKGQVTAMAALKELRKISNLLSEM